jgi:hypothetical protein
MFGFGIGARVWPQIFDADQSAFLADLETFGTSMTPSFKIGFSVS